MLTFDPAGVATCTCMREGPIPWQGGQSGELWLLGLSLSNCGHVFANSVRYIYVESYNKKKTPPKNTGKLTTFVLFLIDHDG